MRLLVKVVAKLKAPLSSRHPKPVVKTPRDLEIYTKVLVRADANPMPLKPPYGSLNEVLEPVKHVFISVANLLALLFL